MKPSHDPQNPETWEAPPPDTIHPDDEEMDQVFADMPQNENCIELFRIHAQGGRPLFLENISPAVFSFAYVTEKFGGGKYLARAKYKDGVKVRMPFDIEGDPFPVKRIFPQHSTPGVHERPVVVVGQPTAESPQGETNLQTMVGMMQTMMQELKGSETAFLEKLKLYKDLFAPQHKQETPLDTAISMFQKGVEMASLTEGGGGPWWLPILRELKEPLTKIVDTAQDYVRRQPMQRVGASASSPNTAPMPAHALPGGQPDGSRNQPTVLPTETASASEPLSTMEPDQLMMLQLKAILPMLINGAAKNSETVSYIDFILDQLPVSAYDNLRSWLMKPDCLESLAQIEPGIRFQQEWWNSLRSGLLEALNEELGHAVRTVHPSPDTKPSAEPAPDHDEAT